MPSIPKDVLPSRLIAFADLKVIRFGLVGVINTLLDLVLFSVLVQGGGLGVAPANVLSYGTGILSSFFLNRNWTFKDRSRGKAFLRSLVIFIGVNLLGLAFSTLLVLLFSTMIDEILAKILSVPLVFCWNFLTSRYLVFVDDGATKDLEPARG